MARRRYTSDLTDAEWTVFEQRLQELRRTNRGRPATISKREMVNAILYRLRTGCQWRDLPHDFPDWQAVYTLFRNWKKKGVWQQLHDALRREVRVQAGRDPEPSALIIDSQSVKADDLGRCLGLRRREKKSRDSSAMWSSTSWACWCASSSTRRRCKTASAPGWC